MRPFRAVARSPHGRARPRRSDGAPRRRSGTSRGRGGFAPGLTISEAEIDALLERAPGEPHWTTGPEGPEVIAVKEAIEWQAAVLSRRAAESGRRGVHLRLVALAERFGLTRFDLDVLLLALAPEIDLRYERLFAYLSDDITRKRPTVNIRALPARCFVRGAPRRATPFRAARPARAPHGLLRGLDAAARQGSLLAAPLEVEGAHHLVSARQRGADPRLGRAVRARASSSADRGAAPARGDQRKPASARRVASRGQTWPVVTLKGPESVGKTSLVEALAGRSASRCSLWISRRSSPKETRPRARRSSREARLWSAALCWMDPARSAPRTGRRSSSVAAAIAEHDGPVFLLERAPWAPCGRAGRASAHSPGDPPASHGRAGSAAERRAPRRRRAGDGHRRRSADEPLPAWPAGRSTTLSPRRARLCLTRGQGAVLSTADVLQACRPGTAASRASSRARCRSCIGGTTLSSARIGGSSSVPSAGSCSRETRFLSRGLR